ncbi:PilZ domain-containing protein [bacterium]|nr:PilZ domain-containing protein [bacterium]
MSREKNGRNRRRSPRVRLANLVGYSYKTEEGTYSHLGTAHTLDLSESGFCMRTREPLPLGSELSFDLKLGGELHRLRGRIVRGEELDPDRAYEFGVRFLDLPEKAVTDLRLYLSMKRGPGDDE